MCISRLQKQISFSIPWIPEMCRLGPVMRFIDRGNRASCVNEEYAQYAQEIEAKPVTPCRIRRLFRIEFAEILFWSFGMHSFGKMPDSVFSLGGQVCSRCLLWRRCEVGRCLKGWKRITIKQQTPIIQENFRKICLTALRFS